MADNEDGYSVTGESLARIGRVVREFETNSGIGPPEQRRSRARQRIVEGKLLENLKGTDDPDVPTTARFQIMATKQNSDGWVEDDSPSIVPLLNRTHASWVENDVLSAVELYPNKWFVATPDTGRLQGILSEDLYAAVNTKRDPSTAIVRILRRKSDGDLKLTEEEKTIVNRFEDISVDAGQYIKFEWMDGEWQPYAANCPKESSSSGSV